MTVCNRCGKENQDHYKFCLGCGAELTAAKPAGGDVAMMKTMMADPSQAAPLPSAPLAGGPMRGSSSQIPQPGGPMRQPQPQPMSGMPPSGPLGSTGMNLGNAMAPQPQPMGPPPGVPGFSPGFAPQQPPMAAPTMRRCPSCGSDARRRPTAIRHSIRSRRRRRR
jgi:hypothetical protein